MGEGFGKGIQQEGPTVQVWLDGRDTGVSNHCKNRYF